MKSNVLVNGLASIVFFSITSCDSRDSHDRGDGKPSEGAVDEGGAYVIAPRVVREDGAYELLATIEGEEPNRRFIANLKLVTAQRSELKRLRAESEKGEDHGDVIKALERKLAENSEFMSKNYGYSLRFNYLFIPVESALVKVEGDETELVRKIESPAEYDRLESLRSEYAKVESKSGADSAAAKKVKLKLAEEFGFDVGSNYKLVVKKGVLYRKVN